MFPHQNIFSFGQPVTAPRLAIAWLSSTRSRSCLLAMSLTLLTACGERNVVRSYYPSGSVKTEAVTKDAVLNGRAIMLTEAGGKLSEAEYKGGVLFGTSISYSPDGKPRASAQYEEGALHGASISFYPSGHKAKEATFHRGVLVGDVRNWSEAGAEVVAAPK